MADKTFHSIKFPGLPDTYKIPDIVNEYSTSSAYAVGDYVLKDGKTYKCTTAIASSGEAWNTSHWTEVKVGNDLQGEVTDLKSAINGFESSIGNTILPITGHNQKIDTIGDTAGNPTTLDGASYIKYPCSYGDVFTINADGGNYPRAYAFVNANGTVLERSEANAVLTNFRVVAPENSAFIIINTKDESLISYTGDSVSQRLSNAANNAFSMNARRMLIDILKKAAYASSNVYSNINSLAIELNVEGGSSYEWSAASGILPAGMQCSTYSFSGNVLDVTAPRLLLGYCDDAVYEIEMAFKQDNDTAVGLYFGTKIFYGSKIYANNDTLFITRLSGVIPVDNIDPYSFHTYKIVVSENSADIYIDNVFIMTASFYNRYFFQQPIIGSYSVLKSLLIKNIKYTQSGFVNKDESLLIYRAGVDFTERRDRYITQLIPVSSIYAPFTFSINIPNDTVTLAFKLYTSDGSTWSYDESLDGSSFKFMYDGSTSDSWLPNEVSYGYLYHLGDTNTPVRFPTTRITDIRLLFKRTDAADFVGNEFEGATVTILPENDYEKTFNFIEGEL